MFYPVDVSMILVDSGVAKLRESLNIISLWRICNTGIPFNETSPHTRKYFQSKTRSASCYSCIYYTLVLT